MSVAGEDAPRWATPAALIADEATAAQYPNGNLNCGLAHGIPGPLAVMALALSDDAPIVGLHDAVGVSAEWLTRHRCDDRWGINWPAMVTLPDTQAGLDEPARAAWCYGTPGVARAIWLAGSALGDERLRALAVESMAGVYRRPIAVRQIDSPTFCHGVAGLLQITLRFWHDTGLPLFAEAAADLTDQLIGAYEPDDSLLGFRSVEPGGNRVTKRGFSTGRRAWHSCSSPQRRPSSRPGTACSSWHERRGSNSTGAATEGHGAPVGALRAARLGARAGAAPPRRRLSHARFGSRNHHVEGQGSAGSGRPRRRQPEPARALSRAVRQTPGSRESCCAISSACPRAQPPLGCSPAWPSPSWVQRRGCGSRPGGRAPGCARTCNGCCRSWRSSNRGPRSAASWCRDQPRSLDARWPGAARRANGRRWQWRNECG